MIEMYHKYDRAYKIRPLEFGNNFTSQTISAIKAAGYLVANSLLAIGVLITTFSITVASPITIPMIVGGMALNGVTWTFDVLTKNIAKLMDIKHLLGKQDMDTLRILANRTRKIKGLLNQYDRWEDVPNETKKHIAIYIDETYKTFSELQHSLAMIKLQRREMQQEIFGKNRN